MKRKDESLRNELLKHAQEISQSKGYDKISIRALAEHAGIATGTVYNYFGDKDEILLAMADEYWHGAIGRMDEVILDAPFDKQLEQIYEYLCAHIQDTAGELMGRLRNGAGGQRMASMHMLMGKSIICYLEKDGTVRDGIWTELFTKEHFVAFLINNMMHSLRTRAKEIDFLVEIVRRILY